jgi:hypothetical protein
MAKINCPHCESRAVRVGLMDGYKFYCSRCGGNHQIVARELSFTIKASSILLCLAVVLIVVARLKSTRDWRAWAGVLLAFSTSPIYYELSSFQQLCRIRSLSFEPAANQSRTLSVSEVSSSGTPAKTIVFKEREFLELAALPRPRKLKLTWKGRFYLLATLVMLILFTLYGAPALWTEFNKPQSSQGRNWLLVLPFAVIYGYSFAFFRNRIRERQLLANGELASGYVTAQDNGEYTQSIQYCFKLSRGQLAFGRCNDASRSLYEGMTVPVFYDGDNPTRSVLLDCSLTRIALGPGKFE